MIDVHWDCSASACEKLVKEIKKLLIFSFNLKKEASKLSKRRGPVIQASPKKILGIAEFWPDYDTADLEYITPLCIKTYMHTYIHICAYVHVCIHVCAYISRQRESAYSLLVSSLRHTGTNLPNVLSPVCRLQKGFSQHGQVLVSTREMLLMKIRKWSGEEEAWDETTAMGLQALLVYPSFFPFLFTS